MGHWRPDQKKEKRKDGHIETDHHVILLITEDVAKHFVLSNLTTLMSGTLREVLENCITPRDNISINGLGIKKSKAGGLYTMLKILMEVDQEYNVFNYGPPIPHKDLKSQGRTIVAQAGMKPAP